jgi:hypothetical protein
MSEEPIPPDGTLTGEDTSPGSANPDTLLPINPNNPTTTSLRDTISQIAANQKLQMSEQHRMKLAIRREKNVEAGAEKNLEIVANKKLQMKFAMRREKNGEAGAENNPENAPNINVHETKPSEQVTRGNSFDKNIIEAYFSACPSNFTISLSVVILFFLAILITLLTKPKK